jgi:hypothetical protein
MHKFLHSSFWFVWYISKLNLHRFKRRYAPLNLNRLQFWIDTGRLDPSKKITMKELIDSGCVCRLRKRQVGIKLLAEVVSILFLISYTYTHNTHTLSTFQNQWIVFSERESTDVYMWCFVLFVLQRALNGSKLPSTLKFLRLQQKRSKPFNVWAAQSNSFTITGAISSFSSCR